MAKVKATETTTEFKTLCFKAYLTPTQECLVDEWLNGLKWVWNKGLSLLIEFDTFTHYNKHDKKNALCSPIGWHYRMVKDAKDKWQFVDPYCELCPRKTPRALPLPDSDFVPALDQASFFSLSKYFASKNHPDKEWFTTIPSVFVRGTLKSLYKAWQEYKKGARKMPRFKRRYDKITTLINEDSKATKLDKHAVQVTKLGYVKTDRSLDERWLLQEPVCTLKLTKKASGYYLQLSGAIPYDLPEANDKAVGIDVGAKYVFATSDGECVDPPRYRRKADKRLARLQRSLSRRQGGRNLKPGQQPSNRYLRRQKQLARQHEKVADQRRLFNHALSTDLVSRYGAIACENIKLTNITRRAKPKLREDGKGYARNNAAAKSGLTKSILDNGLGQLLTFLETKTNVTGGEFVRVPPHYTSQECSRCGTIVKKALSQRTHICPNCGYVGDRDVNAAKVILNRGVNLFKKSYLGYTGKVTDGEIASSVDEPSNCLNLTSQPLSLETLLCMDYNDGLPSKTVKPERKKQEPRKHDSKPLLQLSLNLPGFQTG
jgi:putative transposase